MDEIERLIRKYMPMIGMAAGPWPIVKLKNNLGSRWLGRCVYRPNRPQTTDVEIQKAILSHPRTLERVVAHEVIHHQGFMTMTEADKAMLRFRSRDGHGESFMRGAAKVNAIMGEGFVTVKSDQEYVLAENDKPYYLLISPIYPNNPRLGWAWTVRLSPNGKEIIKRRISLGARLIITTDRRWTEGAKIARFGGLAIPNDDEEVKLLRQLYDSAPSSPISF